MVTFLEGGQDEAKFSLRDYPVAGPHCSGRWSNSGS